RCDDDDRPDEFQCQGADDESDYHGQEELDVPCEWKDGRGGHEGQSEAQKKDACLVDPVSKDSQQNGTHQSADSNHAAGTVKEVCSDESSGNGAHQKSGQTHEQLGQFITEETAQKGDDQ